jgi:hypothetical protein
MVIAAIGVAAGEMGGGTLASVAARFVGQVQVPGCVPVIGAAVVLVAAAICRVADAGRARVARIDVLQALRSE